MKVTRSFVGPAMVAVIAMVWSSLAPLASGALIQADVVNWARHNGTAVTIVNAATKNPGLVGQGIIPAGDNYVLMAPISPATLTNAGDYVKFTVSVKLNERQANTGTAFLNNNLRFGIFSFDGVDPATIAVGDFPNHGIIARYRNNAAGNPQVEVQDTNNANPFVGITGIGTGTADAGDNSIQGANPPKIDYEMIITRNGAGTLDISGFISNEASGGNYSSSFSVLGHSSTAFPPDGPFTFNRVGLFFNNINGGANADSIAVRMTDAAITINNVPEPQSFALVALAVVGGVFARSRRGAANRG